MKKLTAEFVGTFIRVFGGCGSAVFSAAFPEVGIGLLGVSLAFGLTVLGGVYAFGGVSGRHLNPAVSVGLTVAGRFSAKDLIGYVVAPVLGAIVAAGARRRGSYLRGVREGGHLRSQAARTSSGLSPLRGVRRCAGVIKAVGLTWRRVNAH